MATPCFYYANLTKQLGIVELSQAESAHALQSRRLRTGAEVNLINGQGLTAAALIHEVTRRRIFVEIQHVIAIPKPKVRLTLAVAMPKGDRQKVLVDMLTQLGVSKLIPLTCERSISILKDSHLEKLRRISLEACKQSQNPWLLEIANTESLEALLAVEGPKFYMHQAGGSWQIAKQKCAQSTDLTVFIGPEGGFSNDEFMALDAGRAVSVALGEHILRTESAAIAAASLFMC